MIGEVKDAGWLRHVGNALDAFANSEVNDFKGVDAKRGDKEPVAFGVNGEVIEATFDTLQRNGLNEVQGSGVGGVAGETGRGEEKEGEPYRCGFSRPSRDWRISVLAHPTLNPWAIVRARSSGCFAAPFTFCRHRRHLLPLWLFSWTPFRAGPFRRWRFWYQRRS